MSDDQNPNSEIFRLTFNLPAEKLIFETDDAALRIRTENGILSFKSVTSTRGHRDAVPVEARPRGGKQVEIGNGERSAELLEILKERGATTSFPFFVLEKDKNGWFNMGEHYSNEGAPPKFAAHMRVWLPRSEEARRTKVTVLSDDISLAIGELANRVRAAQMIIENSRTERRIGRPTRELQEATQLIEAFENLARTVLPNLNPANFLKPIIDAHTLLGRVMASLTTHDLPGMPGPIAEVVLANTEPHIAATVPEAVQDPVFENATVTQTDRPKRGRRPKTVETAPPPELVADLTETEQPPEVDEPISENDLEVVAALEPEAETDVETEVVVDDEVIARPNRDHEIKYEDDDSGPAFVDPTTIAKTRSPRARRSWGSSRSAPRGF